MKNRGSAGDGGALELASALDRFEEVAGKVRQKRIAVFLDYDGTLTPIVRRPEDAVLSEDMRRTVRALAERCTVAVVSGRDLADVRGLVALDELVYAGSHGFDIAGPDGLSLEHQQRNEFLPVLEKAEAELREVPGKIQGVLIERKKFTIAIHYRLVAERDAAAVEKGVDAVRARHPELRKTRGKKVFELQPNIEWHKGKAVLWLIEKLGLESPDLLPFYLGDDITDEDAFRTLRTRGLGVVVLDGPRHSDAHYSLRSTDEVQRFLGLLKDLLEERKG